MIADILKLQDPSGEAWLFLVLFGVVVGGPLVVQKLKIPGIIGLFFGGLLIGPHGLGFIGAGNETVFALGRLGLLYLMFVAGLELDLDLVKRHRRSVVIFSLLSFSLPMTAGTIAGLALDFEVAAAILLGALLASHTLIVYPTLKAFRVGNDPAVATGVGATVITDTMSLVLLAVVVGSTQGNASGLEIVAQTGLGLAIVAVFCFLGLPRLARLFLARFGASRTNRYVFALVALLAAATLAQVVGIEDIIGAFFAGLALNRLVPNEGDLMHRIDFFGSAVFVPVFMVSVGLVLDPSVMLRAETLEMAGVFVLACLGGKALAVVLTRPLLGFSWPQVAVLFSLTAAQAAATLAVADVGRNNGLFGNTVFNAVLGLILVSLVVASTVASVFGKQVPVPETPAAASHPGRRVLLVTSPECSVRSAVVGLATRLAASDGGVVVPVILVADGESVPPKHEVERLEQQLGRSGIDLPSIVLVDRDPARAVRHAVESSDASSVLVDDAGDRWTPDLAGPGDDPGVPVLVVGARTEGASGRFRGAVVVESAGVRPSPYLDAVSLRLAGRRARDGAGAELVVTLL
jgi:Kef-type K+ transport system membrane component KefB